MKFHKATPISLTDAQINELIIANPTQAQSTVGVGKKLTTGSLRAAIEEEQSRCTLYKNNKYQVAVYMPEENADVSDENGFPPVIHLSIKRLDRKPIHDWRELQEIKNVLVGEEHEAVELYPAESRLVDSANQFHLWVLANESIRFPFGFSERLVDDRNLGGAVNRNF